MTSWAVGRGPSAQHCSVLCHALDAQSPLVQLVHCTAEAPCQWNGPDGRCCTCCCTAAPVAQLMADAALAAVLAAALASQLAVTSCCSPATATAPRLLLLSSCRCCCLHADSRMKGARACGKQRWHACTGVYRAVNRCAHLTVRDQARGFDVQPHMERGSRARTHSAIVRAHLCLCCCGSASLPCRLLGLCCCLRRCAMSLHAARVSVPRV
jgi:hypothetical protein